MRFEHILLILLLTTLCTCQVLTTKKGMTWMVKRWPGPYNAWVGQMYCIGCDPYNGDTPCTTALPILCVNYYKTMARPNYAWVASTGGAVSDASFYNAWSGGVFTVTQPVKGSDITSLAKGNTFCQNEFGSTSIMAEHHLGRYMSNMANSPPKIWMTWNWSQTSEGGWGMWGYFGHSEPGPVWVWVSGQANGNCN